MAEISTALRNVIANAIGNAGAGVNFDSGVLEIRSGAAPGANAADGGTLLASITLPADAFGAAAAGATGTAGHFRIKQSGDTGGATGSSDERIEGSVTATSGGGDLELDSVSITAAQTVTIDTFTVTMPAT